MQSALVFGGLAEILSLGLFREGLRDGISKSSDDRELCVFNRVPSFVAGSQHGSLQKSPSNRKGVRDG